MRGLALQMALPIFNKYEANVYASQSFLLCVEVQNDMSENDQNTLQELGWDSYEPKIWFHR